MSSRDLLKAVISDFSVEKFERFFRAKNRSFRPRVEGLAQYCDANFKSCQKLGEIPLEGGDVAVCAFEVARPLSERTGKRSQFSVGKRIIQQLQCSAGLFVFYDDKGDFRFSLIYDIPQGRRRTWSNFRRYTYFASRTLTNRTLLQRVGDGDFSTLEKMKLAFSVEKVTEEFYQQYRVLFDALFENLQKSHTFHIEVAKHHLDTADFAKKLLGQIVFLYFIQKKGWLGVPQDGTWGDGDKDFLSNQFRRAMKGKQNYFNDVLEPLFYATLNNARRDTTDPSYSEQFQSRIPFLNGGLFESEYDWKDSLIYLDNAIFECIFDTFDRYNFTVEEEGPDDKEIAVDPEMLGKVFENLLPENLRKGKGTYYTPRNIVQYMCRESVTEYLTTQSSLTRKQVTEWMELLDEDQISEQLKGAHAWEGQAVEADLLLASVKTCDPACGSGAFLVGMLNEIVRLRLALRMLHPRVLLNKSEYQLKKETIQNCIYGVDIDPGAVDIAKLRLWLSLIVDHEINQVEPLPNLDYKIMTGNSLLEEYEGVSFYEDEVETGQSELLADPTRTTRKQKIAELKRKLAEYFSIHDDDAKRAKRAEINAAKDWLIRSALEAKQQEIGGKIKREEEAARQSWGDEKIRERHLASFGAWMMSDAKIQEALESIHNPKRAKPFFAWRLEFIDVFDGRNGFDVVIANPPYIRQEEIPYKNLLKQYAVAGGTADIYCYFYELAHNILQDGGVLTFITSNKYLRAGYGKKLRQFLKQRMALKILIDFGDLPVFKATAYPSILIARKQSGTNAALLGCTIKIEDEIDQFQQVLQQRCILMQQDALPDEDGWNIETPDTAALKRKIEGTPENTKSLKDYVGGKMYRGILTGYNDAFVIDTATRDRLIAEDPKSAEVIKPFLRGQDIKRYDIENPGLYLIDLPNGWTDKGRGDEKAESYFRQRLPAIFAHLSQFRKKVNPKGGRTLENRDDQGRYWWELRPCKYDQEFDKPKIISARFMTEPLFGYDMAGAYTNDACYIIPTDDLYLYGVINSRLGWFYLQQKCCSVQNSYSQVHIQFLSQVPIRTPTDKHRKAIEQRVRKILTAKKRGLNTTTLEREVDHLVYEVYGLTEADVALFEK